MPVIYGSFSFGLVTDEYSRQYGTGTLALVRGTKSGGTLGGKIRRTELTFTTRSGAIIF